MSAEHINAFCIDHEEKIIFAGDKSGQLWALEPENFKVLQKVQAHPGTIQGITAHPSKRIVGLLGKDRSISIYKYGDLGQLEFLFSRLIRDDSPDDLNLIHSESQGIAFHPTKLRLVTRSGNSGVLEIDFDDDGNFVLLRCLRPFELCDFATVAYSPDGAKILVGSNAGQIAIIDTDSQIGVYEFEGIPDETIHWFEPLPDGWVLVANDSRRLFKFDPYNPANFYCGPVFSRDDLEHVARNPVSGQILASSFDRNIYEIDQQTLGVKSIVFEAKFKLRWVRSLRRNPNEFFAQVRDGSLLRIDSSTGEVIKSFKLTPPALWSMTATKEGTILVAGEGLNYWEVSRGSSYADRTYDLNWTIRNLDITSDTYTKRIVVQESTGYRFLGRTDGLILIERAGKLATLINVGSAVRDLAVLSSGLYLYAATEDGSILKISIEIGEIERQIRSSEPVWSLALNEVNGWLAYGERIGRLTVASIEDLTEISSTKCRLPKRMRWIDKMTLLVSTSHNIDRISQKDGVWIHEVGYFEGPGNTIEDFDWTDDFRYLVAVTYGKFVVLYDLATGLKLDVAYDGHDYIKSIIRVPDGVNSSGYNYDFMTVGRSGVAKIYRIHDEQLSVTLVSRGGIISE